MEFEGRDIDKLLREMEDQGWILENPSMDYTGKDRLYKSLPGPSSSPDRDHFDMWCIAYMEGDLLDSQKVEFERLLENNPDLDKEWELWNLCNLPAPEIAYPLKAELKKRQSGRSRVLWFSSIAAAAVIALLVTVIRDIPEFTEPSPGQEAFIPGGEDNTQEPPEEQQELMLASKSVLPTIRKEREPSELTGEKKTEPAQPDSSFSASITRVVMDVPLRLALYQRAEVRPDLEITHDRIEGLDLPAFYSTRKGLDWNRISNEGIRIAHAGLKQINRMTGSDLDLEISRGEEGKLRSFRFQTGLFNVESTQGSSD